MRERLYKAKRLDNGQWVKGCLIIDYLTGQYFIHADGFSVNESDKVNEEGCLKFLAFEVNPETVCEYVKNDCKGNQVFENDIVKIDYTDIDVGLIKITGQIVWNQEIGGYLIHETAYCRYYDIRYHDEMEVVGNAFDN